MSDATCSRCGQTFSIRSLFDLNGITYCETCVQKASQEAKQRGQLSSYVPLINKSICARCNTYIGKRMGVRRGPGNLGMGLAESPGCSATAAHHRLGRRNRCTACADVCAAQESGVDKRSSGGLGSDDWNISGQA